MLETLRQDLRYTLRTLRRSPWFALTAILVTALGIGANTAAFSVADFVLIRPLDFPQPDSLVRLCAGPRTGGGWGCNNQLSPAYYRDYKEQSKSFEALGAFRRDAVNLAGGGGEPQRMASAVVTSEVLPLLGVQPFIGRVFDADSGAAELRTAVIGYGLWQARFGGAADVLGRVVNLDGVPHEVIGVMPATFHFPTREVQLWTRLQLVEEDYQDRGNNYLEAVGRLQNGVTFEQARADLDVIVARLAKTYTNDLTGEDIGISFFRMNDEFSPRFRLMLQALCGAALCILLLTCANLGNLLLARASARERELAVRVAVGAGRGRLIRQLITESLTLAVIGGAAGVLVSLMVFPLLSLMIPDTLPIGSLPSLNLRLLLLALLFTVLTGIGFGVIPAMHASRRATSGVLRSGRWGGSRQISRSVMVGIEVAASVVLLVSAGLLLRAMLRVQATDPGFRNDGVLIVKTVLPKLKYPNIEKRDQFYRAVLSEVRRLPGVQSAGYTNGIPMIVTGLITRVTVPGEEIQRNREYTVSRRYVTPQFLNAMGISLLRGRDLEEADTRDRRRVAVVSESFGQRYWPNQDPLGKVFLFQNQTRTVVGVVRDIKVRGLERVSEPQMYVPTSDVPDGTPLTAFDPKDLVIRTSGIETALLPAVRQIIRRVDAEQPISNVMTGVDLLDGQTATRNAQVRVLLALAGVALLVAGVGIYGTLAYAVAQRRHEIGLRLALGADPGRIARGVISDAIGIVVVGLIPGLFVAFAAGRYMSSLLFGVQPTDPTTIAVTVAACITVSLFGALLPAIRAVRVSPMSVLRSD
ncbi:MAG TPA: ABC transporter permease [Bryobacteraceae bacterium]|nr:ABC transporter permease [Bryobacteraceae bacterium]